MNVDTGAFAALTEQVEALTRKADLIGRLVTEHQGLLIATVAAAVGADVPQPAARHPRRKRRHLHAVEGGAR
jgi:hypothetical protein